MQDLAAYEKEPESTVEINEAGRLMYTFWALASL